MRNFILFLAIILLLTACSEQELGTPFVEGQEVTLTASVANSASSAKQLPGKQRVSGKDAGTTIALTWNAGDKILVTVGDKSAVFTLSSGENTSLGTFTGKMPADGTSYSVIYPANYSEDVLTNQTYVLNGFGNGLMKMSTKTNGTIDEGFVLSADNAVLGLQLTGNQTLGRIVLTNINTEKTYTLNCNGVTLNADQSTLFYIVVPVEDWTNGMRLEVYDNDGDIILMKEKAGEIMFSVTDAMVMPSLQTRGRGKRIGIFSVGEGKYVSFSQGNLQYVQSAKEWLFAENQYDFLGNKNLVGEWIDLFDWQGDDAGNFVDWGKNIIQNDVSNTWRTLSHTEWKYLLHDRSQATKLIGGARIEDKLVLVILPDNWVCPAGITFVSLYDKPEDWKWDESQKVYEYNNDIIYNHNKYDANQWQQMEKSGAVAIPATGYIKNGELQSIGRVGRYWSSMPHITSKGYYMSFGVAAGPATNSIRTQSCFNRDDGHTVRLVHDTIPPVLTFTVNGVSFDMIYVEGGTFMMGADEVEVNPKLAATPVHKVTLSDYYIGETVITQPLWTAIMGTNIQEELQKGGGDNGLGEGDDYPMYAISWYDSKAFAEELSKVTGMKFRLPTEAEWEYAARGGKYSRGYKYAGSNTLDEVAWHTGNSTKNGKYVISPVKLKKPNELGLYDMTGNIWEWCQDRQYSYTSEAQTNPIYERTDDTQLVIQRGGSTYAWGEISYRVSYRFPYNASSKKTRCGLRLVLECE